MTRLSVQLATLGLVLTVPAGPLALAAENDGVTMSASEKPGYVADLEAAYGPPSAEGFGSAVFFEALGEPELEVAAKRWYRSFVGPKWEAQGEAAWMGPWKECYRRPDGAAHEIVAELSAITTFPTRMQTDLLLNPSDGVEAARSALAGAFDPADVTEVRGWDLGDGEAMSGILLSARRADGAATFVVLLMD